MEAASHPAAVSIFKAEQARSPMQQPTQRLSTTTTPRTARNNTPERGKAAAEIIFWRVSGDS